MSDKKNNDETCVFDYAAFGSVNVKSIESTVGTLEVLAILPAAKL